MREEHAVVVRTIPTPTGQITLVINDDSHWKASALAVICENALAEVIGSLTGLQRQAGGPVQRPQALAPAPCDD